MEFDAPMYRDPEGAPDEIHFAIDGFGLAAVIEGGTVVVKTCFPYRVESKNRFAQARFIPLDLKKNTEKEASHDA